MEKNFMSAQETADFLGVTVNTLGSWRRATESGDIRGPSWVRKGYKNILYKREDVEKFAKDYNYKAL